jgi:hypothetical protein
MQSPVPRWRQVCGRQAVIRSSDPRQFLNAQLSLAVRDPVRWKFEGSYAPSNVAYPPAPDYFWKSD